MNKSNASPKKNCGYCSKQLHVQLLNFKPPYPRSLNNVTGQQVDT